MTKKELFEYINTCGDKSGNLKKVGGFKKHFPEFYEDYLNTIFPEDIENLPFKQKLWHFLKDIYIIPVCKMCGNPVNFLTRKGQWGYCTYCSGSCAMKDENIKEKLDNTKISRYGSRTYNNSEKQKQTILNKGEEYWKQHYEKSIKTRYEKNGGKYFSQETIEKIKETTLQKYGVDSFTKTKEFQDIIKQKHNDIQKKQYITKKSHHSFKSSNVEKKFGEYLDEMGIVNYEQYKSDNYPYSCDFFIPNLNLFIEIQGSWTHGKHPFDTNNKKDIEKLEYWKSKNNEYYNNAIYTWTDLDVRKRKTANENQLNYLEIFSNNIDECITIFENYLKDLLVDWCLKNDFPGVTKWPANHPIWECNVGNRISPKNAWKDEKYIRKAVNNMFSMMRTHPDFRVKHINEILKCEVKDNEIIKSTDKLLQMILNRFTIAKIAPKVTALSSKNLKKIIDDSGIDISKGAYIPMAGFGGIVEGCKMWGEEHNVNIDIETYDINQKFCDWYGWKQRDMLAQKIVTDKVCICCPPFGKKFEHWDGTPKEMSDIGFKEWYKLIKEYVIAPEYIIIGPEIGSKKSDNTPGLFKKVVGIMLWTDEMIK